MISIGFSTDPGSFISKMIRWFTGSKYSHSFFMIKEESTFGPCVMQADSGGVEITTFGRFDFDTNKLLKEVAPKIDLAPAVKEAARLLNDEYDFEGLLGMTWVELMWHIFKRKVRNPLHKTNTFYCSAFVVKVLQIAKWPNADTLIPESTDAQMLADFLDSNPA